MSIISYAVCNHGTRREGQCHFLVSCIGERPWWPLQSPNKGRKKKAKSEEEREIRSRLLILDLKDGEL